MAVLVFLADVKPASAFGAGFGKQDTQLDLLKDGLEALKEIRDGRLTLQSFIKDLVKEVLEQLGKPGRDAVGGFVEANPHLAASAAAMATAWAPVRLAHQLLG